MAATLTSTYVRANTGIAFPKLSDHNADFDAWRRQWFTDNGVDISFSLSGDELTLTVVIEHDSDAAYQTYKDARDGNALYDASSYSNWIQTTITDNSDLSLTVTHNNDAGETSTLWPE